VDFRDPWSLQAIDRGLPSHLASPVWLRLAERYERPVIDAAALVVVNTVAFERAMARAYPNAACRLMTVMNGADDDPISPSRHDGGFRLRFAGSIYDVAAPAILFEAAARVVRELGLTPAELSIDFLVDHAQYEGVPIELVAKRAGVQSYTTVAPLRPRGEALDFLADATMLVSLRQYSPMAIPAKVFEYVRLSAWLLVMAERDSATELLLRGTSAYVVEPGDVAATAAAIRHAYEAFVAGVRPEPLAHARDFSRRAQAEPLVNRIEALMASHEGA
jgi:hypothetical protein